jgi:D-aspartate ligase
MAKGSPVYTPRSFDTKFPALAEINLQHPISARQSFDTNVPALVLKISPGVLHHGGVGIVRSLGRVGVQTYAVVEDRLAPLGLSRYVTRALTKWSDDNEGLLQNLASFGEKLKRRAIIIPTDDRAAVYVAEHARELDQWFLFPDVPAALPRRVADKMQLYAMCRNLGLPCPGYALIASLDELHKTIRGMGFPLVVKQAEHALLVHDRYSSFIVRSESELLTFYEGASRKGRSKLILQEFIPGEDWIFHGYRNPRTGCFLSFTGRKLRSFPLTAGPTTLGVSIPNSILREQTEAFLESISYAGVMDLDFRRDSRDGKYKLVDFNPRVGANFRMFENENGVDVIRALHLDLTGRAPGRSPMVEGRTFIVEPHDVVAAVLKSLRGELSREGWLRTLGSKREFAWWSSADPLPFASMCLRLALRVSWLAGQSSVARIKVLLSKRTRRAHRARHS